MNFDKIVNKIEKPELPVFKIDLPIRPSPDSHCLQSSVGMILEGWLGDDAPDLDTLERVSKKNKGMGTWPGFMAAWLSDQGYDVHVYSDFGWSRLIEEKENFFESPAFMSSHGSQDKDAYKEYILDHGLEDGIDSSLAMKERDILVEEPIELQEVFGMIQKGKRVVALLDGDHYVAITGFDGESVFYNNPSHEGTEKDRKKKLSRFYDKLNTYGFTFFMVLDQQRSRF